MARRVTAPADTPPLGEEAAPGDTEQARPVDPVGAQLAALAEDTDRELAPPAAPGEGVTDLDAAERAGGPAPQFDPQLADANAGVIMAGVGAIREGLFHLAQLKTPRVTLSDENVTAAADAIAKVLAKHRVNLRELSQGWELELSAAFIVWPVGLAAYAGIKGEMAERVAKAKAAPAIAAAAAAPVAGALHEHANDAPTFPPGDPRNVSLNAGQ